MSAGPRGIARQVRAWWLRLRGLSRDAAREREISDELESHVAMQAAEYEQAGVDAAEARRRAILKLGGLEPARQAWRERDTLPVIENLLRDVRFALRQLRKNPGFSATAVLTLALGIGAVTTVVTWTNAVLYDPWPHVEEPRQICFIDATVLGGEGYSVHYDQYRFVRAAGRSWQDAIAFAAASLNVAERGEESGAGAGAEAQAIQAGVVSAGYFRFLGIRPQVGRFFAADADDRAFGAHDEIVLSDAFWRARFHADPAVVRRTLAVNKRAFTVVGVAPPEFAGIFGGVAEAAWAPLSSLRTLSADAPPDPLQHYGLQVAVRLRPGVQYGTAASEVHALARAFALAHPREHMEHWDLNLRDAAHFERGLVGYIGREIPVLSCASALLLVLVSINIASLLGQRAARRRREIAIRSALGASRRRIAAQVLVETSLLAASGALAGWAASLGMARGLFLLLPSFGVPLAFQLHSDARTLLFVICVTVAVAIACGMYPVRQALRISQNEALHEGGAAVAGRSHRRMGSRILMGLQLGICFVVLVGCGLMTRTALNIVSHTRGFDADHVWTASVDLARAGYTESRGLDFQTALLARLRALPGVESATLTSHLPMGSDGSGNTMGIRIPGYVPAKGEEMSVVTDHEGPGFFRTMGIALREGREFTDSDNARGALVAVVNEAMAQRYWPRGNAVGSSIFIGERACRVVGVVRNYTYSDPDPTDAATNPVLFVPLAQSYWSGAILAVRLRADSPEIATVLRATVAGLDAGLPLESVSMLRQVMGVRYQLARVPAELLGVYSLSSVLVAMLGLYAVMAYAVLERHREFALRIALGSTRAAVFRLVLADALGPVVLGLIAGGLGSIAAVRLLRSLLFDVAPFDPLSYCAAAMCLALTVALAAFGPARRAAAIEPMRALRAE